MTHTDENELRRDDLQARITDIIGRFHQNSPENNLRFHHQERIFDDPTVGFSSGADPLYGYFKTDIGSLYQTPVEVFQGSFPDAMLHSDDLTVISWISPITRTTKDTTRKEKRFPSERGARTKHYGQIFQDALTEHVVKNLMEMGIKAAIPPSKDVNISERYGFASLWSERHAAYVSGLGTFGLCDGLITKKGKAVICGSVIACISLPPTVREYEDHHAWCLYYATGRCEGCITRCPANAITSDGHDKKRCMEYSFGPGKQYMREQFGFDEYGCGLCQCGVPCESKNPVQNSEGL